MTSGPDIAVDAIADQNLAEPRDHRLHQHASTRAPGVRSATLARICSDRGEQRVAVGDAEHDAADIGLVRDLGGEEP